MSEENGLGHRLKQTRESLGLSIWEAASQLYLPERIIVTLEDGDYHQPHLPARPFIRGYLRAYARLLRLPVDDVLADFDALGIYKAPPENEMKTLKQPTVAPAVHRDKFWFLLVGGILLAVLFLLVGFSWLNTQEGQIDDAFQQSLDIEQELHQS